MGWIVAILVAVAFVAWQICLAPGGESYRQEEARKNRERAQRSRA